MKMIRLLPALALLTVTSAMAKDHDIPVTELPKEVTESIEKNHPDSTLISAEKDVKADGTVQHYEVKVRVGDGTKELTVLSDGTIKKTEADD